MIWGPWSGGVMSGGCGALCRVLAQTTEKSPIADPDFRIAFMFIIIADYFISSEQVSLYAPMLTRQSLRARSSTSCHPFKNSKLQKWRFASMSR